MNGSGRPRIRVSGIDSLADVVTERRGLKQPDVSCLRHADFVEVRTNDDGTLDEVIARDCYVHIEQLSASSWWIGLSKNGEHQHTVIYTDRARVAGMTEWAGSEKGEAARLDDSSLKRIDE